MRDTMFLRKRKAVLRDDDRDDVDDGRGRDGDVTKNGKREREIVPKIDLTDRTLATDSSIN